MKIKKGFTLIELLVVIAIIGILATVVIINVAGAKGKANNAKVLADLNSAGKIASQCYVEGGNITYNGVAVINGTNPVVPNSNVCNGAAGVVGVWPAWTNLRGSNGVAWTMGVPNMNGSDFTLSANAGPGTTLTSLGISCTAAGCTKLVGSAGGFTATGVNW